ncbi:MAG: Gfo/Idh/MocA family oxidoreductase [Actinoplanes sp.]
MGGTLRVGIVGAGKISGQYSAMLARLPQLTVTAVTDLDATRAQQLAGAHPGARVVALPELYAADDVDVVLNLTTPAGHAPIALAAIAAGKHVYGEKPLATSTADGQTIVDAAARAGVRAACAPDTVLGTGVQTARAALESGAIGTAHAATAFMTAAGHERWHPDPEFYYQPGGGPLLDMGPYYLTSLVHLLGPIRRVVAMSSRSRSERTIGSGPRAGTAFPVEVDTHLTGVLEHANGALTTMIMTFDVWAAQLPRIEVYGSAGSLSVPDPNHFAGDVKVFPAGGDDWETLTPSAGYAEAGRGVGLLDLAESLAEERPHRASAEVALHVLDVMESMLAGAVSGESVSVQTTCEPPARIDALIELT